VWLLSIKQNNGKHFDGQFLINTHKKVVFNKGNNNLLIIIINVIGDYIKLTWLFVVLSMRHYLNFFLADLTIGSCFKRKSCKNIQSIEKFGVYKHTATLMEEEE
jgi:hypothetical protein